jgi:transcriptional regulator with XRE-family HTH domain
MTTDAAVLNSSLGPSLRRWRVLNRVKQEALARDLGVSQSKISRWESGSAQPKGADQLKILKLLRARPESSADRTLLELVTCSSEPVHLVCDLTHRLLAVSPARATNWHVPTADLMNRPLWRFASEGIREMEGRLAEHRWFEPLSPDILFHTEDAHFPELTILQGKIRISRLSLSDGSYARLVRDDNAMSRG